MNTRTLLLKGAVALSLVAALVVPASAFAASNALQGPLRLARASTPTTAQAQARQARLALLRQRIALVLQNRKARFDGATLRISARAEKLSSLADSVEKVGGDVSAVRTSIAKAASLLSRANDQEALAVAQFQAVPDAAHPRIAFAAARAQGRVAAATLNLARVTLRNAVLNLRAIVNGLKAAAK